MVTVLLSFLVSDSLLRDIKALVARHSDRLSVSGFTCYCTVVIGWFGSHPINLLYVLLNELLQMDTIRASNKGYSAEISVVTFNHVRETMDNGSKIHVLLVSFRWKSLRIFSIISIIMPPIQFAVTS